MVLEPSSTPVSDGTATPVSCNSDAGNDKEEELQPEGASSSTPKRQKLFFDVREMLKNHPDGGAIESEMDDGLLSSQSRIKAVRIFVSHLMEKYGDRPKSHIKEALARSIIVQFPKLKGDGHGYEAWYTTSIAQHAATGYLEERLRNVRKRTAKKNQLFSPQRKSELNHSTASSSSSLENDEEAIDPAEVEAMTQWLKHNKEPLSQVRDYQRKTARKRLSWIKDNPDKPVKEIFVQYPRLLDTPGLISMDFAVLKPGSEDHLFHLWTPGLAKSILQYADKQNDWSRHLGVQLDNNTDDEICNIALQCLPCIFPTGSHKIKGKSRRATINEAISSFVDARKIGTNIPAYLENVKNKQPFVLVLGARVKPEQVFVIIEREAIPQDSLLKAVDLCFKCFYVYDIDYPWQTCNSWQFLQSAIFGIEGIAKATSSSVMSLKAFLKIKRKPE